MTSNLTPVILAGGSGTRLWPLSRQYQPKQFMGLIGERSLFQETLTRMQGIDGVNDAIIVTSETHRFLVTEQASEAGFASSNVILEPSPRNTAPALTLAALFLTQNGDDPVMLVMPADHLIQKQDEFQQIVAVGAELGNDGSLVTLGIAPRKAEVGYGYIKKGSPTKHGSAFNVDSFVEKPDGKMADRYFKSGEYLWNSGIFMMRASVWLDQLAHYRPDIGQACKDSFVAGDADGVFFRPDKVLFQSCPSDSIDYAVVERAASDSQDICAVIPLNAEWSDVGAWSAVWEAGEQDTAGNVVQGDVYLHNMKDSLVISRSRLVGAVGLENVVVIETTDAILIADRNQTQDVREIVNLLKSEDRPEQLAQRRVHRPWGWYEVLDMDQGFQVKRITVNPSSGLSLQRHKHRAEHWVVVQGKARVTKDEDSFILTQNQSTYVPKGTKHRLENPGDEPLEIIEVQTGEYLGEDDIERFADDYNRHLDKPIDPRFD